MLSPRWRKLVRDVQLTPGRVAMMVLAIAIGVCALATMLTSYSILERETRRNYLATNPPSATLTMESIEPSLVAQIRRFPGIAQAQAGTTVRAGLRTSAGASLALTIFVVDDFNALQINTVYREAGAWPPPQGSLLLERDALALAGTAIGDKVEVKTSDGVIHAVPISGTLHDPALPPASRGQTVYAYASPATVTALGMNGTLRNVQLTVSDKPFDVDAIEVTVARLAIWLREQGHPVLQIRIPPPGEHPHQKIMNSILVMLLIFSVIALILSAVLTATILGGMLAQQTRQIGVMKTIGARTGQIVTLYLTLVLAISAVATVLGMAGGIAAGRAFAGVVLGALLNFSMGSDSIAHLDYLLLVCAGIVLPLLISAVPIMQAARTTVQAAICDVGSSGQHYGAAGRWLDRLPFASRSLVMALRNTMRRRGRLLLTLSLLACAGAMYISSLNVRAAAKQHLLEAAADRRHDIETFLSAPAPVEQIRRIVQALPGVELVEPWSRTSAAKARADALEIERTYPDGDHGSLAIMAVPEPTAMLKLPMLAGSWLLPGDKGTAVLNNTAQGFFPGAKVGDDIDVSSHGHTVHLRVAGIARQYMSPATVFVTPATYALFASEAPGQSSVYRIVTRAHDASSLDMAAQNIEAALAAEQIRIKGSITETMMRKDVDGHFDLMIGALLFISVVMALVGVFGLGSAMGSNVAERSREFGIMRSIGATSGVVLRNVLAEGLFVGLMSVPLALVLSLPLSAGIGSFLGNLLFGLPFPFVLSQKALLLWLGLVSSASLLASGYPAWRASRMSIHQTLSHL